MVVDLGPSLHQGFVSGVSGAGEGGRANRTGAATVEAVQVHL